LADPREILNLIGTFRERIDEIIRAEGENLFRKRIDPIHNEINPHLVYFIQDFNERALGVVDNDEEDKLFLEQKQEVEYLHSQQLALLLAPIIKEYLVELSQGGNGVYLTEIGAKNGDLIRRIDFELRKNGGYRGRPNLTTNAYDLDPKDPLTPKFFKKHGQPESAKLTDTPKSANLLDLDGAINHPTDILLLSNILHKIKPDDHKKALQEAYNKLSPRGVLIINTPFYSDLDKTAPLKGFYQRCDTNPNALLSWEEWEKIVKENGFEIIKGAKKDLGFKASLLDGFRHRTLVARKPIFSTNPFNNDSDFKGAAGRIIGTAKTLGWKA
jgi:hypothetical protein